MNLIPRIVRPDTPSVTWIQATLRRGVAVDGSVICGFATVGPCGDEDDSAAGELYGIYIHPDWWNRGAGRLLIHDARERFVDLGFQEAVLWVLVGNERAERFYDKDGWRPDGQHRLAKFMASRWTRFATSDRCRKCL
jgi:GNAT superfamily N-acetyltransferase